MPEQVITLLSSGDILSAVSNNLDMMAGLFNRYFSGADNLRMVSIILMLLAFILFLFLIIILYVKSIISFLKSDQDASAQQRSVFDDENDRNDRSNEIAMQLELEKELEKELERELEQAQTEKQFIDEHDRERQRRLNDEQAEEKEAKDLKKQQQKQKETQDRELAKAAIHTNERIKTSGIDLDWKKGKIGEIEANRVLLDIESLQYQQSRKGLNELLGLIIDMAARGVDDLKVAQTVMFRNQGQNSEDDIMQVIEAIKDFIALCLNDKFEQLKSETPLPKEDQALFHLAKGDPSLALALMEALMDNEIDRGSTMSLGTKRDMLFQEVSNYACTFGTLASLSDIHLATGAFELSIELAPQNVNAWSRAADMYAKAESNNKAIWAYENVLNLADEEIYPRQTANANKMLSQFYYAQGNSLQAAKLYNSSKQYYDSIGINRRLDKKEVEIIEIIESRQNEDLETTISKILQNREMRQYSYA